MGSVKAMIDAIDRDGWGSIVGCWGNEVSIRLRNECEFACETGDFKDAGVGRGELLKVEQEVRRDSILWLISGEIVLEQKLYLERLETLRLALNERFFLGLFDFEGHFALYPEGGFYKPHLDRHSGTTSRMMTVILYLNENWRAGDGGELKLWTTCGEKSGAFVLIEPRMGTLVCFPSADYWHEVLPTTKSRMSITGWFRRREER
jgi:SM-20-related protein